MATTGEPFGLFWDSESGDRTYSAASFEYWLKKFFTSGVFNGDLQVNASSGMTLGIEPGYANVDGKVKFWNGAFTLTLNAANSTYPRIDTIVITRDNVNRQIVCEVVTGSYSGDTPQPTAPVRNSEIYQLVLAQIYVGAGVTGITQANITDTRPDNTLCGWITGTVEELDFSQFTAQFEQYFREFKADAEGDYESWFNEVQSEQIEDKEAWDAWYAALQEELHELPADSAEYLQIQIDELRESGLSGSIFKVTTINPSLEGKTVRIISADNTEEKTGTFDSNLECVIYGMKSVGEITITSTDGIQTATSVVSIPYFGNYTVPIAFWAATVNMQGDTNLYGATITIKDSDNLTVGTVVLSAVDGTGTFTATKADTYTFNYTYQGISYSEELVVSEETTYSISLSAGFNWQIWVDTASQLDSSDYDSLDEVLEDEKALRELFLEHACVDYMASVAASNEDLETVINNDYCAKWINLSDYALDFLGANAVIKALMDEADKYGYGEWTLMPQVPKMTSNTAPFGVASASTTDSTYYPWKAFDNDNSTGWSTTSSTSQWISYDFINPVIIKRVFILPNAAGNTTGNGCRVKDYRIEGSNDNFADDVHILGSSTYVASNANGEYLELNNDTAYRYYRCYVVDNYTTYVIGINTLQFYAWAPKGNVPIMTANNAPYGTASGSSLFNSSDYSYYGAFNDIYEGSLRHWCPTQGESNSWLAYSFVNPTKIQKAYLVIGGTFSNDKNFKIQAKDSSGQWNDVSESVTVTARLSGGLPYDTYAIDVASTEYALSYRLICDGTMVVSGSNNYCIVERLQFYGRELKVSVPTMTSNTAPFGEASASSEKDSTSAAWKAFDKDVSTLWRPNTTVPAYCGYKFTSPSCVKRVGITHHNDSSIATREITHGKIQASNDNVTWVDIVDDFAAPSSTRGLTYYVECSENSESYLYYRVYVTAVGSGDDNRPYIADIQFYGEDYSEKEFEAGTTKKWLYDHGVELESVDETAYTSSYWGQGSVVKGSNKITVITKAVANGCYGFRTNNAINIASYNLLRAKIGNAEFADASNDKIQILIASNKDDLGSGLLGYATFGNSSKSTYLPNDLSLDVSAINSSGYAYGSMINSNAKSVEYTEMWLE